MNGVGGLAGQQFDETVDVGREEVLAPEIENGAMLSLTVFAVRLDESKVLVEGITLGWDPDSA